MIETYCKSCFEKIPKYISGMYLGNCMNCDMTLFSTNQVRGTTINWDNKCKHCCKTLAPIGSSRLNGKQHDDWENRGYHKKCFIQSEYD